MPYNSGMENDSIQHLREMSYDELLSDTVRTKAQLRMEQLANNQWERLYTQLMIDFDNMKQRVDNLRRQSQNTL